MSKIDFEIRLFESDDLPQLHLVRTAAFLPVYQSFRSMLGEQLARLVLGKAEDEQGEHLDDICRPDSHHRVFVALTGNRIVGFCDVSLDEEKSIGVVGLNAVDPQFGNLGIGTGLYEHVLGWIRDSGAKVAMVSTGDDPSHAPARRAYEKAGFDRSIPARTFYLAV